jgi:AcrR family transcriptional regulator
MENRARILEAAARVYAEYGFRGATTRRIAIAAGVNEVTLFRTFGSKAALIDEAVRSRSAEPVDAPNALPTVPLDPERELTRWASALLDHLRASRALIRKTMSEVEERSEAATCAAAPTMQAAANLRTYMIRMAEAGFFDLSQLGYAPAGPGRPRRSEHAYAAGTMLMAAIFSDAMGREMMPDMYPQPAERAPALYVRMFLRAIGVDDRQPAARSRAAAPSRRAERTTPPNVKHDTP